MRRPATTSGPFLSEFAVAGCLGASLEAMHPHDDDWEERLAALWAAIEDHTAGEFYAELETLLAQLPPDSAVAVFERAGAQDSTGHPDLAVPLYREALDAGLHGERRRRAVIQLASSLRNLGQAAESVRLLERERARDSDHLDGAVAGFLALALHDVGRDAEALALALGALAPHLPRYQRSLANYARIVGEVS